MSVTLDALNAKKEKISMACLCGKNILINADADGRFFPWLASKTILRKNYTIHNLTQTMFDQEVKCWVCHWVYVDRLRKKNLESLK